MDPLRLWNRIVATHQAVDLGDATLNKQAAQQSYDRLAQGPSRESIGSFRQRFQDAVAVMVAVGIAAPANGDQAANFLNKLNDNYSSYRNYTINNASSGVRQLPDSIADVAIAAERFIGPTSSSSAPDNPSLQTVFTAQHSQRSGRGGRYGPRNPGRGRSGRSPHAGRGNEQRSRAPRDPRQQREAHANTSSSTSSNTSSSTSSNTSSNNSGNTSNAGNSNNNDQNNQDWCIICRKKGHHVANCRRLAREMSKHNNGRLQFDRATLDDHGNVRHCFHIIDRVMVSTPPARARNMDNLILLDNQATKSIFMSKHLLRNIRPTEELCEFSGIFDSSEGVLVDLVGDHPDFGIVHYHPKAVANVVSFSKSLTLGCRHSYDTYTNIFTSLCPTGVQYDFPPCGGLYAYDANVPSQKKYFRDLGLAHQSIENVFLQYQIPSEGSTLAPAHDSSRQCTNGIVSTPGTPPREAIDSSRRRHIAPGATVEDNSRMYSRREKQDAASAKDLIRILGYPSPQSVINTINSGAIINCPVTAQHIRNAYALFGPDVAALRGKSTHHKPITSNPSVSTVQVLRNLTLDIDVMFVNGYAFLLSVSTPLGLTIATFLGTGENKRTTPDLDKALREQLKTYKSSRFTVDMIQSDNEGALASAARGCRQLGIFFNPVGPGQHAVRIERKIREVKEIARSVYHSLPFTLPRSLIKWLVSFAVARINLLPHKNGLENLSPREAFIGRKVDFVRDLRCGFGEYAECTKPVTNNTLAARTEPCLWRQLET